MQGARRGGDLAAAYAPVPGVHDEMMDANGLLRPHWMGFIDTVNAMTQKERRGLSDQINRLVREHDVAHDIFADPDDPNEPWAVDLFPLIFSQQDWALLEPALLQRARLANALLGDIYGPQRTLKSGLIPPAMIFNDRHFVRPAYGIAPRSGYVQFFAVDVVRAADGGWQIVDCHTETPAGPGLALANRVITAQTLPNLFRTCKTVRLANYFQAMQTELARRAGRADPRIALITPGAHHDDYFSHAYLARYLNFFLVEGGDVQIVGSRAFLKTLEGLKSIDLIVRCAEGIYSDPLELDPAGFSGPVGLLQACRSDTDFVVNPIGSAVAENRGLSPVMADLARELLNEELLIPDVPRVWLGDPGARDYVLNNLDRYVIKPAQEGTGRAGHGAGGVVGSELSPEGLADLKSRIAMFGAEYIADEIRPVGTTPSLTQKGLEPVPFMVRLYVSMTNEGFAVLPGGLSLTVGADTASLPKGPEGHSRDVWVIAGEEAPASFQPNLPTAETARIERSSRGLQSRVADNLFWLGRYVERADWVLRMERSALHRLENEERDGDGLASVKTALDLLLDKDTGTLKDLPDEPLGSAVEARMRALFETSDHAFSVRNTLANVHRVASMSRDRLSLEAWRTLNTFNTHPEWRRERMPVNPRVALEQFEAGIATIAAFSGMAVENMTRNYGWRFMDMGRRIERAQHLAELLSALFQEPNPDETREAEDLLFVLELADSYITYRSRYRFAPALALVLDLLLIDETNPRSIAFQLDQIAQHLDALPLAAKDAVREDDQRQILMMLTAVRLADVNDLSETDDEGERSDLAALFEALVTGLPELSEIVTRRYLSLTEDIPRRLYTRLGTPL